MDVLVDMPTDGRTDPFKLSPFTIMSRDSQASHDLRSHNNRWSQVISKKPHELPSFTNNEEPDEIPLYSHFIRVYIVC